MGKESGHRLRELRKESKLTMEEFSKLFSVAEPTQTSYENGSRDIPLDYAVKVCDKYGVTLNWLSGRSENRNAIDMLASIVLALDKIIKVGYRFIPDHEYNEPVLWVDKIFAKYLQEIDRLRILRNLNIIEDESFLQLRLNKQKKYEGYLKELFGEDNFKSDDIRFDEIEAVEIAEFLACAYYKDL